MFIIRSTQPDDQPFQWDMAQALGCIIHHVSPFTLHSRLVLTFASEILRR